MMKLESELIIYGFNMKKSIHKKPAAFKVVRTRVRTEKILTAEGYRRALLRKQKLMKH
jgi:hypothetical protein